MEKLQSLIGVPRHGDHRLQGQLARLDRLQHQKAGHQLGGAGGVGPLAGLHIVEDVAVVGVQEDGVGAEQVQVLLGGGNRQEQGQHHGKDKQHRKKTIFFHRKISICML